jgi:hypothetical protein
MKSKKQIKLETGGDIFTLDEFCEMLDNKAIVPYFDGIGYFHDGEKRTEISIDNPNLSWDDVKNFPYVCWYNK